jgi:integrase
VRRGPHEGSIYQGKDGRWVASIHLGYEGGRRRRKAFYGATRREVQQKLVAALRDLQAGIQPSNERLTVNAYFGQWLRDVAPTLRPRTHERYAQIVNLHILPTLGRVPVARVTPQQVQALLTVKGETLAPATVVYIRSVLRRALGNAVRWGIVHRNVAALVDPPRIVRREVRPLSPEEARRLLDAVRGDRLEALFTVALAVGVREGEGFALQWDDVDFEAGTLTVRHSLLRMKGRLELAEPKTERSRRTIALPDKVVASLRAHRARQLEERFVAGAGWQDWNLVFATEIGTPLHRSDVLQTLHRHLAAASLPPMRFHDLRHACASLLLAQGVDSRTVMMVLGHSNIDQTAIYTHVLPALARDAASLMDEVLGG